MKFLITGDFVIKTPYDGTLINQDLIDLFNRSDYNIVNLEAPVTSSEVGIDKTGPHHKAHRTSTAEVLKKLNVNLVTLANNHFLDYGKKGVEDTLNFCDSMNIETVGGGINLNDASEIFYLETAVGIISIVNFAENEWSSATANTPGANPMNLIDNITQIQKAKASSDFVFVIVHGGHEYYNLPSPRMQQQYRFYASQGADIVIGHHTHCISGNEIYNGTPIYYSLGNFLFTKHHKNEDWYTGLVLEIEIKNNGLITTIHPVRQTKNNFQLELLQGRDKESILKRVSNYSKIIASQTLLNKEWDSYISSRFKLYLSYWAPIAFLNNQYVKLALKKMRLSLITKTGIKRFLNLMRCEAHFDVSKEIMQRYLQNRS